MRLQLPGDPRRQGSGAVHVVLSTPPVRSVSGVSNARAVGADVQQLLRLAMQHVRISRFELMEPSLEEIFIDTVGKSGAEALAASR